MTVMAAEKDAWTIAFEATVARIEAHPQFSKLIREVAVAEASHDHMRGYQWLRRNSLTYGSWMTRGMRMIGGDRRARTLGQVMAAELWPDITKGTTEFREKEAAVYVTARNYVRARQLKH